MTATAVFLAVFALPGALLGSIVFGRLSDKIGARNIKHRLTLIAMSIFFLTVGQISLFLVPLPELTLEQGMNIGGLFVIPAIWTLGGIMMIIKGFQGIYDINQPPVLQAINVPEAQGIITAWNQFLETLGRGVAPLIAGLVITTTGNNYFLAAAICGVFGLPGGFMWWYARKKIDRDISFINNLLKGRATEIGLKRNKK
ncbi:MAG: hypothetical protein RBG13Loki_4080 [Promethearchaeota archaeon CR_4]|nr:MAG: hypothetical protein RBG13Loki_4080 [Candidatus Lokiarchaeota archaeon CR_4]